MQGGDARALPSALGLPLPQLLGKEAPLVFLDYDGTLSPIVPRPEDAELSAPMQAVLLQLSRRCPVAVISGRDLADVKARVGISGIGYAGSHGFDFVTADGKEWRHPEADRYVPQLDRLEQALADRLGVIPGAQIERKRYSLSAHFRRVATADLPEFQSAVEEASKAAPGLHHGLGKMVHDFRPDLDWNKGRVLHALRERMRARPAAINVFIGDDRTDEDAFSVLGERDIGVVVGVPAHPTTARYGLRDTIEVKRFLEILLEALARRR